MITISMTFDLDLSRRSSHSLQMQEVMCVCVAIDHIGYSYSGNSSGWLHFYIIGFTKQTDRWTHSAEIAV